jgi:hypothetical protein
LAAILLLAGDAAAQTPSGDAAVAAFTAATREYAALHRRLERELPPLQVTPNPDVIAKAIQDMANAIRAARPTMKQGDFFTDDLGVFLRRRVAEGLATSGFTPDDVRATEHAGGVDPAQVPLKVGEPFHWIYGSAMFPCVLHALPSLPPELQYRIVGSTLVLIDVHASLIVDVLPSLLAETER